MQSDLQVCNPALARRIKQKIIDDDGCGGNAFIDAQSLATRWGDELRTAGHKSDASIMLAFSHMGYENKDAALAVAAKHGKQPELTRSMTGEELGEAIGVDARTARRRLQPAMMNNDLRQSIVIDISLIENPSDAVALCEYLAKHPTQIRRPTQTKNALHSRNLRNPAKK